MAITIYLEVILSINETCNQVALDIYVNIFKFK